MTGDRPHQCPVCSRSIPPRAHMCIRHWQAVPQHLRMAVYRAYRREPGGRGLPQRTAAYLEAIVAAVKAVQELIPT